MPSIVALCGKTRQKISQYLFIFFFKEGRDNICINEVICSLIVTNDSSRGGKDVITGVADI